MRHYIQQWFYALTLLTIVLVPSNAQQTGTPTPIGATFASLTLPLVSLSPNGPTVGVLAFCADLTGAEGAQNTVNMLLADGRFGSVTLINGTTSAPTAQFLLSNFKVVVAMTDNRCGFPLPQTIADAAANALSGFIQGGGGAIIATFGFSNRGGAGVATAGLGFGSAIFNAGLSPFQPGTPSYNAPAGLINIAGASSAPPCNAVFHGVTSPVSSTYANYVSLSAGATLCGSYANGTPLLAINASGNVIGLNTFPANQSDNTQISYQHLVSNAVIQVVCGPVIKSGLLTKLVDNTISVDATGKVTTQPSIRATFTPQPGLTLSQAAGACGFTNFDWQQTITSWPGPSSLFQNGNATPLTAPPPFFDPAPGGYTYCPLPRYGGANCDSYPLYWNANTTNTVWSLSNYDTNNLSFYDSPAEPTLPLGDSLGFKTQLVGILPNSTAAAPLYIPLSEEWTWTDTFNGTSGGIAVTASVLPVDPGSGTGFITITGINGVPQTPPSLSCSATPSTLWPPNGKSVLVTVSGVVTSGTQSMPANGTTYEVIDEYSQVQPSGGFVLGSSGQYSFGISLIAARNGDDQDGRKYTIIVSAKDTLGNGIPCLATVTVPHDQGNQ